MRKRAKKPHILKHKVKLSNLILKKWKRKEDFWKHPRGCYWKGTFYSENGIHIFIFFQNYVRRPGVDYVRMHYNDSDGKALTPTEIKDLITQINEDQ